MAEILGAVASAAQLAATSLSLLDLLKKIKGGSSALKKYQQQLHELQNLSESISHNPLLQTADVDYHTRSILFSISQNNLEQRLQKGWFLRTCTFFYIERDLLDLFTVLDRQKSSLSLVIEHIQAKAIHQIQSDIRIMADRTDTPPTVNRASSSSSNDLIKDEGQQALTLMLLFSATKSGANVADGQGSSIFSTYPSKGSQWTNNYAGRGAGQHNGPIVDGSLCSPDGSEINTDPDEYRGNTTAGGANQVQGATILYSEDHGEVKKFPVYHGKWDNNTTGDSDKDTSHTTHSGQLNGHRYMRVTENFNFWGFPQGNMAQKKEE